MRIKVRLKLWCIHYRQGLLRLLYMQAYDCLHIRIDINSIHVLSILNIEGLSRPKSSRNLSSDRLETNI